MPPRFRLARAAALVLAGASAGCFSPAGSGATGEPTTTGASTSEGSSAGPSSSAPTSSSGQVETGTTAEATTSTVTATEATTLEPTTVAETLTAATTTESMGTTATTADTTGEPDTSDTGDTSTGAPAVCGDGILDPSEECEDGNLVDGDGCSAACTIEGDHLVVFLSGAAYSGEMLADADAKCQQLANTVQALKGREFVAWVSRIGDAVKDRVGASTLPYRRVDGQIVALGTAALLGGSLKAAIDRTETGAIIKAAPCASGDAVWTGTTPGGEATGADCGKWTQPMEVGRVGGLGATDGAWSSCELRMCTTSFRIYCIEKAT
jgi:cysteine-rich repeat protein